MEFIKIQDAKTLDVIQYRIDNIRVKKHQYEQCLDNRLGQKSCFLTKRTKSGNFRHSFYLSGIL